MDRLVKWLTIIIRKRKELKRWQRAVTVMAAIITFATTYALILPAITVEKDNTGGVGGMYLEQTTGQDDMREENALEPTDVDIEAEEDSAGYSDEGEVTTAPAVNTLKYHGDDYIVTLTYDGTSGIPEGAELSVSEVAQDSDEYQMYLEEARRAMGLEEEETLPQFAARFFDIKIMVDDQEFTPETGVSVEITYEEPLAQKPETEVNAVHFTDETAEAEVIEASTTEVRAGGPVTVEFMAESFSVYGVIYTVDFHWEVDGKEYEYSLAGGDSISFRELVEMLHVVDNEEEGGEEEESKELDAFVNHIVDVEFSAPELVWVQHITEEMTADGQVSARQIAEQNNLTVEYSADTTDEQKDYMAEKVYAAGEWVLLSIRPFLSEEFLTVYMRNGDVFTIKVTDAQIVKKVLTADGENYTITVTYSDEAEIPDHSDLNVTEILSSSNKYQTYVENSAQQLNIETRDIAYARFFDIEIVKDGEKIEPKVPVQVKIEHEDGLDVDLGDSLNIVHFAENGTEVIDDVKLSNDQKEIVYMQGSFSVVGEIKNNPAAGTVDAPNKYAIIVKYDGKLYSVNSDGTLSPVSLVDETNPNKLQITNPMLWSYDDEGSLYHHSEATDFGAGEVSADFYYKYLDVNSDLGIYDEERIEFDRYHDALNYDENTVGNLENGKINEDVILWVQNTGHPTGQTRRAWKVLEHRKKSSKTVSYNAGTNRLTTADGSRILDVAIVDGVPRIVGKPVGESAGVEVYFADVSDSVPDVSPYNHTVNHIDISVEGEVTVGVPLAYGTYYRKIGENQYEEILKIVEGIYYEKNDSGEWVPAYDDNNQPYTNNNPLTVKKDLALDDKDMKGATLVATDKNGEPVKDAFYISGYSANAPAGQDTQQVRIEGSFKVADCAPVTSGSPNTDSVKSDRNDSIVYYTLNAVMHDVPVTIKFHDEVLYNDQHKPMEFTTNISVQSKKFSYWDKATGTNLGNTCPALDFSGYQWQEQTGTHYDPYWGQVPDYVTRYWDGGGIYTGANPWDEAWYMSGIDNRLKGSDVTARAEIPGMEITKYIIDQNGNQIALDKQYYSNPQNALKSSFKVFEKTTNTIGYDTDDVKELNGASATRATGILPAENWDRSVSEDLYDDYVEHTAYDVTLDISSDGEGFTHNYNITEGMYYIEEDPSTIAKTIIAADGTKYAYTQTHLETEYAWRDDEYTDVAYEGSYRDPVHVSPTYTDPETETYRSIPEVVGNYKDTRGSWVQSNGAPVRNSMLPFYVYNVYRPVTGEISTTKQWQQSDGTDAGWLADITFKILKKGENGQYSDVTTPEYYENADPAWSDTITVHNATEEAKWDNLDVPGNKESYVIVEWAIAGVEEKDIIRDENSHAITSFKLNGTTYFVLGNEISDADGKIINKAQAETDIEVEKKWNTPEGLSPGTSTMLLYQVVGESGIPSSKIHITIQADPVPVTTDDGNIRVEYEGTKADGSEDSGFFNLNNDEGWSKTKEFDRGGIYSFKYFPDEENVLTAVPDKVGEFSESTTVTLATTAAEIPKLTYKFTVPQNLRRDQGYITVICNGDTKIARKSDNSDEDWTVEFEVAKGTPVTYSAVADGKFIEGVSLNPESTDAIAIRDVNVTMTPDLADLTLDADVKVNWNELPDEGTSVTVNFIPDKDEVNPESVTLTGNTTTWTAEKTLQRLDSNGDLITWTITSAVSPAGGTASVALSSPSDGKITESGDVIINGTVDRGMNLRVKSTGYANFGGIYYGSVNGSDVAFATRNSAGTLTDGFNKNVLFEDLDLKYNGNDAYYVIRIWDQPYTIKTNAENVSYSTNARETDTNSVRTVVYIKAQPGDVTIEFEKSNQWSIQKTSSLNAAGPSSAMRSARGKVLFKGGNGNRQQLLVTPSVEQTFYDDDIVVDGTPAFSEVLFKDLPENATLVTGRDDVTKVISGDGTYKWEHLPAKDANGNPIYYYIVERDATAVADTMSVKYEYTYNDDGSISKVKIINTTEGIPEPTTGTITVTKTFTGLGGDIPENFRITNDYNEQVFTVSGAGGTVAPTGTNPYVWTITEVPDGTVINFTESGIQAGGYNLTVNGTATAAASATVAATAIKNQVVNANLMNAYELKTTDISLKKVDKKDLNADDPELLQGATFILSKYTDSTFQSKDESWGTSGSKTQSDTKKLDGTYTLNGEFTFDGLTVGYYQLEEDDFPEGHIQLSSNPTFKVEANASNVLEITLINNPDNLLRLEDNKLTIVVGNEPGAALPSTGGPGTFMLYLLGFVLVAFAGTVFMMKRRFGDAA